VLVPDYHAAVWVLWNQPAVPAPNHATPWLALAPHLGHGQFVSGGLGRLVNAAVAVLAGLVAHRWRRDLWRVVWLIAVVLAARSVFEAVMVPYYVMPGLALALVAARASGTRFIATILAGSGLTVMAFTHHGSWQYWLGVSALTVLSLAVAWPRRSAADADDQLSQPVTDPDTRPVLDPPTSPESELLLRTGT